MEKLDNSFVLFKNDMKKTEKHPDMTGSLTVNGIEYYLSAWTHAGTNGRPKFLSGSLTPKQDGGWRGQPKSNVQVDDSNLPF